jgi:hypothetical protein
MGGVVVIGGEPPSIDIAMPEVGIGNGVGLAGALPLPLGAKPPLAEGPEKPGPPEGSSKV